MVQEIPPSGDKVFDPNLGEERDAFPGEIVSPGEEKTLNRLMREANEVFRNQFDPVIKTGQLNEDEINAIQKAANIKAELKRRKYLALSRLTYIFPEGIDKLSFGVKKVKGQDENSPSSFIVEINPPIPESKDWTDALTSFLSDPLLQRTLLRLTPKSTSAAELEIGIKRRMVDIGSVGGRSVKATEENTFYEKYQRLKDSK